jgi:hypothetical protein
VTLAGCLTAQIPDSVESDEEARSSQASPRLSTPEAIEPEETPDAADLIRVGDAVVNYGIELTIHDVTEADSVSINQTMYEQGSGYEEYTPEAADDGGKYVLVRTTVNNIGKAPLDLTCGWPIDIVLVDEDERQYEPSDSLYEVEGNPGCSDNTAPGFAKDITYPFMIPADASPYVLAFADTESGEWEDYALISLLE